MYSLATQSILRLRFSLRNTDVTADKLNADVLKSNIDSKTQAMLFDDGLGIDLLGGERFGVGKEDQGLGEVVAEFSSYGDNLKFSGNLLPNVSVSSDLPAQTQTYKNLVNFFLRELKSFSGLSHGHTLEKPGALQIETDHVNSEVKNAIEQLTHSLESKCAGKAPRAVQGSRKSKGLNAKAQLKDRFVDLFEEDLRNHTASRNTAVHKQRQHRTFFEQQLSSRPVQFRLFDDKTYSPIYISGFLNLEIGQVAKPTLTPVPKVETSEDFLAALKDSFTLVSTPRIFIEHGRFFVHLHFFVNAELLPKTELFVHWGKYGDANSPWVDDEILIRDIVKNDDGSLSVVKEIHPTEAGDYGLTMFIQPVEGTVAKPEKIWSGKSLVNDAQFSLSADQVYVEPILTKAGLKESLMLRGMLQQALVDYDQFLPNIYQLSKQFSASVIQRSLYEMTMDEPELQGLLSKYYARASRECLEPRTGLWRARREVAVEILDRLGLGEIVFVTPEGHHAIAGGLAQMIVGITNTLARDGMSVSIVTPLYDQDQGNKHRPAEDVIREGVVIRGQKVPIRLVGNLQIPFGATYQFGTKNVVQSPENASVLVYLAEVENLRIYFLRHRHYASKLYPAEWADQQLRKAIFLSRGTLELVRNPRFGLNPSVIVTNDWQAGLTQVYLKTDPRYSADPVLKNCRTMHILHNCGQDYQGRMPTNQFGTDIWHILGIDGGHYFGLQDKATPGYINLTRGAIFHTTDAVLAVSKPYAEQLLTDEHGEGLQDLLRGKQNILYGISNGIDVEAIRQVFCQIGEAARANLADGSSESQRTEGQRISTGRFLQKIHVHKKCAKLSVQKQYGLIENDGAVLLSMIGRLAEQKGITLLTGEVNGITLLEHVLINNPEAQIIIGGPAALGDAIADALRRVIKDLEVRYPGRIVGVIDFIKHRDALAITLASDLFLMPSRFEPGGITQLEALAAGTLVVARNVGGLAATLKSYNFETHLGDSFLFDKYSAEEMAKAVQRGVDLIRLDEHRREAVIHAAKAEHDWKFRLPKYLALFQYILGAVGGDKQYRFLYERENTVVSAKAVHKKAVVGLMH